MLLPSGKVGKTPLLGSLSRKLTAGSLGLAVIGGAGLTSAMVTRDQYRSADLSEGPMEDLYQLNQTSGHVGWVGLGLSASMLTAALWVGEW